MKAKERKENAMRYHLYSSCREFEGVRSIAPWVGALCLGFALLGPLASGAQAQVVTEFSSGITAGSHPWGIAVGPDGNLWFTENNGHKIGRINPTTGAVTEYSTGITSTSVWGITAGPDGNLWFTEHLSDRIGKLNPTTGAVTEYSSGITTGSQPYGITAGPDGNLWFTENNTSRIGKINPTTGVVTEYSSGISANAGLRGITAGPDGNLWFTETSISRIGKINPATGVVTEYSSGITAGALIHITAGADGNLWFTDNSDRIGKINPTTGAVTEYHSGISSIGSNAGPSGITAGPDGNLWFTEYFSNRIGRINPTTGVITEYGTGITAGAGPFYITAGPDGNLWFTELSSARIGRITVPPPPASLENPQPGSYQSGIGLISGWSCQGPTITVSIDGNTPLPTSYGTPRADTAGICGAGQTNSGFGLLLNFNTLGSGPHSAQLFVNGTAREDAAQFTVVVPAGEFLVGQAKEITVPDFPAVGRSTVLIWQESQQNFAIKSTTP
jgi:streptogramin lyase